VAVERGKMLPQPAKVEKPVDAAQQMITRHVFIEIERVKEPILIARLTHHGVHLRQ
jgi:hypothetical protein